MDTSLLLSPPSLRRVILPMPASFTKINADPQQNHFSQRDSNEKLPNPSRCDKVPNNGHSFEPAPAHDIPLPALNGYRTSLDLEGALVDKAIENVMTLPQEVQEAVSMQKLQNNEITRCEKYLATILEQERRAENNNDVLLQEISSIDRKIYFTKESFARKQRRCLQLSKDIDELIVEVEHLNRKREASEKDVSEDLRMIRCNEEKMSDFRLQTEESESSSDSFKDWKDTRERIRLLQLEINQSQGEASSKETLESFKREIGGQINEVRKLISEDERLIADKYSQISEEKKLQENTCKSLQVLEKRNAAQLLRIKKQVKEAQLRNRAWNSQIQQLEQSISLLQEKIKTS